MFFYTVLKRFLPVLATILCSIVGRGQSNTPPYNDAPRQRLLIRITAHYLHTVSQGQIDMDSAIRIPCRVYGLNPLLVYNEGYSDGKPSAGTRLLDAGNVKEARKLLTGLQGEDRLRLLIELGSYLVFNPGTEKADLDEAARYTNEALQLSQAKFPRWKTESLTLQANLLHQQGLEEESQQLFAGILAQCNKAGNIRDSARTLLSMARALPYGHPARLSIFEKALPVFQSLHAKDKEIETLSEINVEHFIYKRYDSVEQITQRILSLHKEINYHHDQYPYDVLAYLTIRKGDLLSAISYSDKSLNSLRSAADSTFLGLFYTRKANMYTTLQRSEEALVWYSKALENRSAETRLYWYKAFLGKAGTLSVTGRAEEALNFIREIGSRFPPVTLFEKMHNSLSLAVAYDELNKNALAEENYKAFLQFADVFPPEYVNDELPNAFLDVCIFYLKTHKVQAAKEALDRLAPQAYSLYGRGYYYYYKFRIDSTEKRYPDAISDLQLSHKFMDSSFSVEQRKKVDELLVKYEAAKKDRDIESLNNQNQLQLIKVDQANRTRNITLAGITLLLIIVALLFNRYTIKQKNNRRLEAHQKELDQKNAFLETLNADQEKLLKEKEWLVREVHHRVKNNLQLVTSLLNSQSAYLDNEAAVLAVKDSLRRMQAMSLIHQKLYQSEDIATIFMPEYISELAGYVQESFDTAGRIVFEQHIEPLHLDVSQAIPIGLIINESIVNAIKYAFLHGEEGIVSIALHHDGAEHLLLKISDNGVGLPEGMDIMEYNSLGLDLMKGLARQLKGSFHIESNNGVQLTVRFNVLNK